MFQIGKIFAIIRHFAVRVFRKVFSPFIPRKGGLPFQYWLHVLDGSCESELLNLHRISSRHDVAIDVGTNVGLYSFIMSKHFSKVYAFEINDGLTESLAAFNPGNIEIINKGLSSQEGNAILYIPVLKGLPLTGWASLTPGNCPDTHEHLEKPVKFGPLDSYDIHPVSFIKIDVEGHELEVLNGAAQTLLRNRPTVLVEIKPQNLEKVFLFFAAMNYKMKKLEDLIGIKGSDENFIFLPGEKL